MSNFFPKMSIVYYIRLIILPHITWLIKKQKLQICLSQNYDFIKKQVSISQNIPIRIKNLAGIINNSDFSFDQDADAAFLVGAFPRLPGMERKDLLTKNIDIFRVIRIFSKSGPD